MSQVQSNKTTQPPRIFEMQHRSFEYCKECVKEYFIERDRLGEGGGQFDWRDVKDGRKCSLYNIKTNDVVFTMPEMAEDCTFDIGHKRVHPFYSQYVGHPYFSKYSNGDVTLSLGKLVVRLHTTKEKQEKKVNAKYNKKPICLRTFLEEIGIVSIEFLTEYKDTCSDGDQKEEDYTDYVDKWSSSGEGFCEYVNLLLQHMLSVHAGDNKGSDKRNWRYKRVKSVANTVMKSLRYLKNFKIDYDRFQILENKCHIDTLVHLNRVSVNIPGSDVEDRGVHDSSVGFLCLFSTPEGGNTGENVILTSDARVQFGNTEFSLMSYADDAQPSIRIAVNGKYMGELRINIDNIPHEITVFKEKICDDFVYYLWSDSGRTFSRIGNDDTEYTIGDYRNPPPSERRSLVSDFIDFHHHVPGVRSIIYFSQVKSTLPVLHEGVDKFEGR